MPFTAIRRAYISLSALWAAAVVVAPPALAAGGAGRGMLTAATRLVYVAGAVVCHQRPERSFMAAGMPLPVCARCTGIYVVAAAAALALAAVHRVIKRPVRSFGCLPSRSRLALAAAVAVPTVATLLYEWSTGDMPSNAVRFAAGAPMGALVSWITVTLPRVPQSTFRDME